MYTFRLSAYICIAGWTDDFVNSRSKNAARTIFLLQLKHNFRQRKESSPKIGAMSASKKNLSQEKITQSGTDVRIKKIFLPKTLAKILAFFSQTTASFAKS
jgi:hypothetical protein